MEKRTFQDLMSIKKVTAIEHCYQRVETLLRSTTSAMEHNTNRNNM